MVSFFSILGQCLFCSVAGIPYSGSYIINWKTGVHCAVYIVQCALLHSWSFLTRTTLTSSVCQCQHSYGQSKYLLGKREVISYQSKKISNQHWEFDIQHPLDSKDGLRTTGPRGPIYLLDHPEVHPVTYSTTVLNPSIGDVLRENNTNLFALVCNGCIDFKCKPGPVQRSTNTGLLPQLLELRKQYFHCSNSFKCTSVNILNVQIYSNNFCLTPQKIFPIIPLLKLKYTCAWKYTSTTPVIPRTIFSIAPLLLKLVQRYFFRENVSNSPEVHKRTSLVVGTHYFQFYLFSLSHDCFSTFPTKSLRGRCKKNRNKN